MVIDNRSAQASGVNLFLLRNLVHCTIVQTQYFAHMVDLVISQRQEGMILSDIFEQVGI
jgi:hypothetical protein